MVIKIIKSKDGTGIIMRTCVNNQWIKISLESDCSEKIMPGDKFISPSDGIESIVVGFSDSSVFKLKNPSSWGLGEELIWALKKGESGVGCFDKGGNTKEEIKATLVKAKKPMTAETAVEIIGNFQNS